MNDIDRQLRRLAERTSYPADPDLTDRVMHRIERSERSRSSWGRRLVAVAAAIVVVVVLVPGLRHEVAGWLGLRQVTLVDAPALLDAGDRLDLGTPVTLERAAELAGFTPVLSPDLGAPDAVFVVDRQVWMLHEARADLPEGALPGIGAVVTQIPLDAGGIVKSALAENELAFFETDGLFGVWIEGPHELQIPGIGGTAGRLAGNTLLWETDTFTFRLEAAIDRARALDLARSFR